MGERGALTYSGRINVTGIPGECTYSGADTETTCIPVRYRLGGCMAPPFEPCEWWDTDPDGPPDWRACLVRAAAVNRCTSGPRAVPYAPACVSSDPPQVLWGALPVGPRGSELMGAVRTLTDPKPAFFDCAAVRGRPRLTPEELERRKALALALLTAGTPRRAVAVATKLDSAWVKRIAEEHGIPSLKQAPSRKRTPAAVTAERNRRAVEMLRAGHSRAYTASECVLTHAAVKALAEAHGIARQASGRPHRARTHDVTRMTHAELDALERRVAAKRWRPATTVLLSAPAGGAYVELGEDV